MADGATVWTVWTVGHSTRSLDELVALLRAHGVQRVVDVRTVPRSRRNPQFAQDVLGPALREHGLGYERAPALGGLRRPRPDSVNGAWRNASFRGYADHMQTPEFAEAVDALAERARDERLTVMCAEAVPWRCHRSLVGDALLVRGAEVLDIMSPTTAKPHTLTSFARVDGTRVWYPPEG
ncbi:DUF488 family protein [Puerhibacterium sp. TATVAM-FAB25]|uniref:DUF488 domain-containing protein n=1 Tax=Puerhibacterium sp. TATVAM-FAB25 TaxID=3093699 RepID=UPI00397E7EA5